MSDPLADVRRAELRDPFDYPDGVSRLIEYRNGREVIHHVPHYPGFAGAFDAIVDAFYERTLG